MLTVSLITLLIDFLFIGYIFSKYNERKSQTDDIASVLMLMLLLLSIMTLTIVVIPHYSK